jgi:hypothetical protein
MVSEMRFDVFVENRNLKVARENQSGSKLVSMDRSCSSVGALGVHF